MLSKEIVNHGTDLAKGILYMGHSLEEMSREELLAVAAMEMYSNRNRPEEMSEVEKEVMSPRKIVHGVEKLFLRTICLFLILCMIGMTFVCGMSIYNAALYLINKG